MDESTLQKLKEAGQNAFQDRLRLLTTLVNENTFTENIAGVNRAQDLLEGAFWALKLHTERVSCPKRGDVLIAKTTPDPKNPILLSGHIDTVHPVKSEFKTCVDLGTKIKGPGTCDMKAGLIQILLALDMLKAVGPLSNIPIKILINSAEEDTTPESQELLVKLAKGARYALVFEFGRDSGAIVVERKGIIECLFESKGKEAHAGNNFFEGKNAIMPLVELATKCASLSSKEEDITSNIATIEGGTHWSTVPGAASMKVQIRSITNEISNRLVEQVKTWAAEYEGVKLSVLTEAPPLNKLPETDELVKRYIDAAKSAGEELSVMPRVGGLSDANLFGNAGIPVIDGIGPMGGGAHSKEEHVIKESILTRALTLAVFLKDAVG